MQFKALLKATLAIFIASLVLLLTQKAEAHSYADCIDWRFKDHKNPSWSDKNGACYGYARRFPINKRFAKLDSDSPNRHYQQSHKNPDPSLSLACSDGKQGEEPGADETMANPISAAYNGKDKRGRKTGAQTVSTPGGELCVRWPAKNHAVPSEKSEPVTIALSEVNPKKDPTQLQFLDNIIAKLKYNNCTERLQKPDIWPCGDCFNLPKNLKPGNFVMQWRWKLNSNEWYTSCADIKVKARPVSTPTAGIPSKITSAPHTPTNAPTHRSTSTVSIPTKSPSASASPTSIASSASPISTASSTSPNSTASSASPNSTASSVSLTSTATSASPNSTASSASPNSTASSASPNSTASSASPNSTAASVPPTPTSASAVIPTTSGRPIAVLVLNAR